MTRKVALRSAMVLALLSCLWVGEGGLSVSAWGQEPPAPALQQEPAPAPAATAAPASPPQAAPGGTPAAPVEASTPDATGAGTVPAEGEEVPLDQPKPLSEIMHLPQRTDWAQMRNPVPANAASVQRGQALYLGKGMCYLCHGKDADGASPVRSQFKPVPNNFYDDSWHEQHTDGQIMQVLEMGKPGTGMVPFVPDYLTEAEGWDVINYLRSLKGKTTDALEAFREFERKKEEERLRLIKEAGGG